MFKNFLNNKETFTRGSSPKVVPAKTGSSGIPGTVPTKISESAPDKKS